MFLGEKGCEGKGGDQALLLLPITKANKNMISIDITTAISSLPSFILWYLYFMSCTFFLSLVALVQISLHFVTASPKASLWLALVCSTE